MTNNIGDTANQDNIRNSLFDLIKLILGLTISLVISKNIESDLLAGSFIIIAVLSIASYIRKFETGSKRPEWVWIIVLLVLISSILSLYESYQVYRGFIPSPKIMGELSIAQNPLLIAGSSVLILSAASTLFLRIAFSRWLWLAYCISFISGGIYSLFTDEFPSLDDTLKLSYPLIAFIYAFLILFCTHSLLIAYYAFQLGKKGYYTHLTIPKIQSTSIYSESDSPDSDKNVALQRPIWLTLGLLLYGFVIIPLALVNWLSLFSDPANLTATITAITTHSLMALSVIGVWRLQLWGIVTGVMGLLVVTLRLGYIGTSFDLLEMYLPSFLFYIFVFYWLKAKKKNDGLEN
ncbi:MAG: hypothetical protein KUG82_11400 [Pseudomonadales bacterium]|nr:hypothetical protein [Pseudomonadales bacterium]